MRCSNAGDPTASKAGNEEQEGDTARGAKVDTLTQHKDYQSKTGNTTRVYSHGDTSLTLRHHRHGNRANMERWGQDAEAQTGH